MTKRIAAPRQRASSLAGVALCMLATSACSNEDKVVLEPPDPGGAGSGGSGMTTDPTPSPLYVVSTRVSVGDEPTGYLVPLASLDDELDLDRAVETTVGTIYAAPDMRAVFHASADEPTITRWDITAEGGFEEGPVLSLVNLGVATADGALSQPFYADDKAYFLTSGPAAEIVVWNPEQMELIGTIPLELEPRGSLVPTLTSYQRDDRLFVTVFWQEDFTEGDWSVFGDRATLIEIDPETDEVVSRVEDERCNVLDRVSRGPDGTAYFSPRGYWIPLRAMLGSDRGAAPCALRVVPSGATFEQGFDLDLSTLVEGRQAGDLTIIDERTALLDVWHPELVTPVEDDGSNWSEVVFENGHLWWQWTIGSAQAELIPDQEPGAYGGVIYEAGGRKFVMRAAGDFSSSTLFELEDGRLSPVITGPGYFWGIARIE